MRYGKLQLKEDIANLNSKDLLRMHNIELHVTMDSGVYRVRFANCNILESGSARDCINSAHRFAVGLLTEGMIK